MNIQSLYKKTPLIGKNLILTRQRVNESRPHQRRIRRQPAIPKRWRFKPMTHLDRLRGQLGKKLCWRAISENSQHGNARKKDGFWCEVLAYIESKTKQEGHQTNVMRMAHGSGAEDKNYVQRATIHYQDETGVPCKFRHCWDVLKDSPKFQEIAFSNFNKGSAGSSKRHKSSGNSTIRGRDKARVAAKNKGSKASGSSTMNDNALARLMVNEMTYAEVQQREAFMELKRRDVECREREIADTEYRAQQEDIKLYLQPMIT
nr:hypothetical protein [Tanacetum cinerariifolium]